ncbi:LamG domain-containing protein [Spirosoma sp. SC4-14]|uniref:LamG domain-containing protein n=1 Tax=Spirosoma sp. SC4-14 TaxID=3128900 RepID=UPI0030D3222F
MKRIQLKITVLLGGLLTAGLSGCYKKFDPESYAPALSIGGFTSSSEIGKANLIGYWPFDGDYIDKVSNKAGTPTGTSFTNGLKGQAMKGAQKGYMLFDPTDAILKMQSFTLGFWVNSQSTTAAGGIIGLVNLAKTDGFWGNIDTFFENGGTGNNGIFKAHIQNGTKDAWVTKDGITNIYNSWNHIALTYDASSSTFVLYVNGNKVTTTTVDKFGGLQWSNPGKMVFGTVQFQTDPSLTTGSESQSWASYLTGALDEVRLYNAALNANEINSLVKLESRGN